MTLSLGDQATGEKLIMSDSFCPRGDSDQSLPESTFILNVDFLPCHRAFTSISIQELTDAWFIGMGFKHCLKLRDLFYSKGSRQWAHDHRIRPEAGGLIENQKSLLQGCEEENLETAPCVVGVLSFSICAKPHIGPMSPIAEIHGSGTKWWGLRWLLLPSPLVTDLRNLCYLSPQPWVVLWQISGLSS